MEICKKIIHIFLCLVKICIRIRIQLDPYIIGAPGSGSESVYSQNAGSGSVYRIYGPATLFFKITRLPSIGSGTALIHIDLALFDQEEENCAQIVIEKLYFNFFELFWHSCCRLIL